jgi:hypothetical protein
MKLALRDAPVLESVEKIVLKKQRGRSTRTFGHAQELAFGPPSIQARALRALREQLDLPARYAASSLGLRPVELEALEQGRKVPVDPRGWELAGEALVHARQSLATRSIQ